MEKLINKTRLKENMKKGLLSVIFITFILSLCISINASLTYYQWKFYHGQSVDDFTSAMYSTSDDDTIQGNNLYEIYFRYSIYPKTWNQQNPSYPIDYCNITFSQLYKTSNQSVVIFNKTILATDNDISNEQYFFRLDKGEVAYVRGSCKFNDSVNNTELYIPVSIELITPTRYCKACQYYQWSLQNRMEVKAKTLSDYSNQIWSYVTTLVNLNFQILYAIFWIFLILMIFFALSLIFLVCYWAILWIEHGIKK
jgi:hypothetical protein